MGVPRSNLFTGRQIGQFEIKRVFDSAPGGVYDATTFPDNRIVDYAGMSWGYAAVNAGTFTVILPPNGPSYTIGDSENSRTLMSASGFHSGGVTASRLDGSVTFISQTVDCGTLDSATRPPVGGTSPFGVWGAMGSISGGESKSL